MVNFLAAVLSTFHLFHIFLQRQALVCSCIIWLSSSSMKLLHLHIVILFHFSQCEGNVFQFLRENGLHIFSNCRILLWKQSHDLLYSSEDFVASARLNSFKFRSLFLIMLVILWVSSIVLIWRVSSSEKNEFFILCMCNFCRFFTV